MSLSLAGTVEVLLDTATMAEDHHPTERKVSPPQQALPLWREWSYELAREMYVKRAMAKLNFTYPD
jgi:hypothetical protein